VTKETKNPLLDLAAAAATGKSLYAETCSGCHGETGKGDGPAAVAFDPKPGDLTKGKVPSAPDGELFLVVKEGKKVDGKTTMEPVKRLTDEQIWQVVAYVRTLANK
jgi:mono/diheme cytochrome c family protein